ncbi:MAG: PIN/TRAM domain-containing protein, partial [Planctomycetota bacterium]|nr:PIN/TRAM domain-containing protein [Planctomycetota bacterium]
MLLIMIRAVFVLVVAGLGVRFANIVSASQVANPYVVFGGVMIGAIVLVAADLLTPRKRIQAIS